MKNYLLLALLFCGSLLAHNNDDNKKPTDVLPISNLNDKDVQLTFNKFVRIKKTIFGLYTRSIYMAKKILS